MGGYSRGEGSPTSLIDAVAGNIDLGEPDHVYCSGPFEIRGYESLAERLEWLSTSDVFVALSGRLFPPLEGGSAAGIGRLYGQIGPSVLQGLNGEFLAVIYHPGQTRAILARDHFGGRPLYYRMVNSALVFSSSFRSLAQLDTEPDYDETGLLELLVDGKIGSSRTLLRPVRKARPGHYIQIDEQGLTECVYWDAEKVLRRRRTEALSQDEFRQRLRESVAQRMTGLEPPFYSYLSGGTDSSLVSCLVSELARETETEPRLVTLSLGIDERGWDEEPYARLASERIGSVHKAGRPLSLEAFPRLLEKCIRVAEESAKGDGGLPYYCAALHASEQGTKHVFSGDGADGSFGGRPSLLEALAADTLYSLVYQGRVTASGLRLLRHCLARYLDPSTTPRRAAFRHLLRILIQGVLPTFLPRKRLDRSSRKARAVISTSLVPDSAWAKAMAVLRSELDRAYRLGPFNAYRFTSFTKSDPSRFRALWNWHRSASVVPTYPFMDRRVCEPVLEREPAAFYERPRTKDFLRRLMEKEGFSMRLVVRGKSGFYAPLMRWYANGLRAFAEEMVLGGRLMASGLLDRDGVLSLFSDIPRNWELIGTLVNLEIWLRVTFGDRPGRPVPK